MFGALQRHPLYSVPRIENCFVVHAVLRVVYITSRAYCTQNHAL